MVVDLVGRNAVKVPPYRTVALRLQKLVGSGTFGIADVVRVAREDQTLAALLLRYANSAHYRGVGAIASPCKTPSGASASAGGERAWGLARGVGQRGPLSGLGRHADSRGEAVRRGPRHPGGRGASLHGIVGRLIGILMSLKISVDSPTEWALGTRLTSPRSTMVGAGRFSGHRSALTG
jgi:hypothetical protein